MKQLIACLLLGALFGVTLPMVSALEEQSSQHLTQEIETLKQRVSELEKQLQTVENVEKLELQAKLAEANAKLGNAEFGKFERELRDSNDEWLIRWGIFILAIVSVVGLAFWFALKSLIANGVEKSISGFKEGLEKVDTLKSEIGILKNQQRVLERERTAATLEDCVGYTLWHAENHPEQIKGLGEEALLDVFGNKGRIQEIRYKAAEVLVARRSPRLVTPLLKLLNLTIESDSEFDYESGNALRNFTNYLGYIYTQETFEGLSKFVNRLLTENPEHKQLFLTHAVFSLALVSLKLNLGNSVSMLKLAVPQLDVGQHNQQALMNLARHFDIFNEPAGIKEMLTSHGSSLPSEVIDKCLELLEKHDPKFVEEWRARKTADESEA